jgi:hypothetical protein
MRVVMLDPLKTEACAVWRIRLGRYTSADVDAGSSEALQQQVECLIG